jgi:serine/threonine protein kinase
MEGLHALVGKKIGRYRLGRLLGHGGMGAVYEAVQEQLARRVAVKVLLPSLAPGPPPLSFLDRFRDEARLVATLNHPNILPVYDFGIERGIAYLVMPYAAGGSLDDQLDPDKGGGPLSLQRAAHYLKQAATALDYAHSKGIVHRDVKPQNLLLEGARLMLSDFGLARMVVQRGDVSPASAPTFSLNGATIRGTPCYLAPEQGGDKPVDWRADIYALGVTLYEMLAGDVPFTDNGGGSWSVIMQHILKAPPSLVGRRVDVTLEIEAVVMKALEKEPRKRYRSAGEMALAFRRAIAEGRILALPAKPQITVHIPAIKEIVEDSPGKEAGRICPVCGTVNRPAAKYCMRDGTRLSSVKVADAIAEANTLRLGGNAVVEADTLRLVSDAIADADTMGLEEYILACPTCGFINRSGARFCVKDGTLLYRRLL